MTDAAAIVAFCDRAGLPTQRKQNTVLISRADGPAVQCVHYPDRDMLMFLLVLPELVPEDRIGALTQAAALANSGSFMGAWTVNSQTRRAYYRITLPTLGATYADEALTRVLEILVGTYQTLAPRLAEVLRGTREPTDVLID
jgi:hypothetical protein